MPNYDQRQAASASFRALLLPGLIALALRLSQELPARLSAARLVLLRAIAGQLPPSSTAIVPL